jgi:hypothetical protein
VGAVLNGSTVEGLAFDEPQSWDGFVAFLDANYNNVMERSFQYCDDTIVVGPITWFCNLFCAPQDLCTGFFSNAWAPAECLPMGDPPCLPDKPVCTQIFPTANIVAFDTMGGPACHCLGPNCVVNPAAVPTGTGIMHDNDICQCKGTISVDETSWGRTKGLYR